MNIMRVENHNTAFKGTMPLYNMTSYLESNVLLNKAIFDITGSDIPWVVMANNKEERRERANRGLLSVLMVFISPLVALPLVNRFAMRKISKLTPKLFHKQYNAVKLSNEYLVSAEKTKEGLAKLKNELAEKKINLDIKALLEKSGGSYDTLRKKIIDSKNIVLGFDMLMVSGVFGHIGFFNDWQTRRKTGQIGYSAELNMADKNVIEKRAKKQEEIRKFKYAGFLATLAAASVAMPLAIRHGLNTKSSTKFANYVKRHGERFDYKDAIFMSRLPMAISFIAAHTGVFLASRNKSEMKDNAVRSTTAISIFFLGDLLLASILGQAADKFLHTNVINRQPKDKNFLFGILPPAEKLNHLKASGSAKTKAVATAIFWFNFASLSVLSGFISPMLINKMIKKDVNNDVKKANVLK